MKTILNALASVIVKVLIYIAAGVIRLAKAILVIIVAYLAGMVVDLFAKKLYKQS